MKGAVQLHYCNAREARNKRTNTEQASSLLKYNF